MAKFVIVLVAALMALTTVNALKCYQCESNCKEYKDEQLKNCTGTDDHCYIYGNPDDEDWKRGCGPANICDSHKGDKIKCTSCKDDSCNSSNYLTGSIILSASVVAILKILY